WGTGAGAGTGSGSTPRTPEAASASRTPLGAAATGGGSTVIASSAGPFDATSTYRALQAASQKYRKRPSRMATSPARSESTRASHAGHTATEDAGGALARARRCSMPPQLTPEPRRVKPGPSQPVQRVVVPRVSLLSGRVAPGVRSPHRLGAGV